MKGKDRHSASRTPAEIVNDRRQRVVAHFEKSPVCSQLFYEKHAYENVFLGERPGGAKDLLRARFVSSEIVTEAKKRPRVLYVHRCSNNE
jgi:hypothetical protein